MTPDEIVRQHRRHVEVTAALSAEVRDYAIMVCDDILTDLKCKAPRPEGKWIACADRMPEQNTPVLAYRQGRINIGEWRDRDDGKSWTWAGTTVHEKLAHSVPRIDCEFSHWMDLPTPPPQRERGTDV